MVCIQFNYLSYLMYHNLDCNSFSVIYLFKVQQPTFNYRFGMIRSNSEMRGQDKTKQDTKKRKRL